MHPLLQLVIAGPIVWFTVQLIALSLFRQNIIKCTRELILSTILISITTYTIHALRLPVLVTAITPAIIILCFRFIYKFQWKQAVIIVAAVYTITSMIEILVYYIYAALSDKHILETFVKNDDFSLIIYCELIYLFLAIILSSFRLGFTFINKNDLANVSGPYMNTLFCLSVLCLSIIGFSGVVMHIHFDPRVLLITIMPIIILLAILLELHYRKEIQQS